MRKNHTSTSSHPTSPQGRVSPSSVRHRRGPCNFKQSDFRRAVMALRATGYTTLHVLLKSDGAELLASLEGEPLRRSLTNEAPFDRWMKTRAREA